MSSDSRDSRHDLLSTLSVRNKLLLFPPPPSLTFLPARAPESRSEQSMRRLSGGLRIKSYLLLNTNTRDKSREQGDADMRHLSCNDSLVRQSLQLMPDHHWKDDIL